MKPKFITFEGPDGSGKTTAISALEKYLKNKYPDQLIMFTREPGGTKTAEAIRKVILSSNNHDITATTEAFLYAASRRQHLETKIWPALAKGAIVFCDRYIDSSLIYQGYARNLGVEYIREVNNLATNSTWPEVTIFFDIKPDVAHKRLNNRSYKDRLENEGNNFQQQVYQGYQKLIKSEPERFIVINAAQSKKLVLKEIISKIESWF